MHQLSQSFTPEHSVNQYKILTYKVTNQIMKFQGRAQWLAGIQFQIDINLLCASWLRYSYECCWWHYHVHMPIDFLGTVQCLSHNTNESNKMSQDCPLINEQDAVDTCLD